MAGVHVVLQTKNVTAYLRRAWDSSDGHTSVCAYFLNPNEPKKGGKVLMNILNEMFQAGLLLFEGGKRG